MLPHAIGSSNVTNATYSNGDYREYRCVTRVLIAQVSTNLVTLFA